MIQNAVPTFIHAPITQRTENMIKQLRHFEEANNVILTISPVIDHDEPNVTSQSYANILISLFAKENEGTEKEYTVAVSTYLKPLTIIYPESDKIRTLFDSMVDDLHRYHFYKDFIALRVTTKG